METGKLWDIFCKVVDNYGDIGVCWRLAVGLATRGERVRLWVDDNSALAWMCPDGAPNVEVRAWTRSIPTDRLEPGSVLLEAFGCEINPEFIAFYANGTRSAHLKSTWINLEYLSAEGFPERCHGLPSLVATGPGAGLKKHFFYPGFSAATGGLLREPDLPLRQTRFDRQQWLQQQGIEFHGERLVCLFCYEAPRLDELLDQLARDSQKTRLLITEGRATACASHCIELKNRVQPLWNGRGQLSFSYLPALTQREFDHLLWACDLNFVRGEDSLVRALWANKPFVWQIYPQHDDAHHVKLDAFLNRLQSPASLREFHQVWNCLSAAPLPPLDLAPWQQAVSQARELQLQHADLVTQIIRFTTKNP